MGIIYMKDYKEIALEKALEENKGQFKEEYVKEATEELAKAGLRYNDKTGEVLINKEFLSKPVDKKDIRVYDSVEELVEGNFTNEILNGASRLSRGFKAL